jgi:hypothetical protein
MSAPAAIMRNNAQVTGMVLSKCIGCFQCVSDDRGFLLRRLLRDLLLISR